MHNKDDKREYVKSIVTLAEIYGLKLTEGRLLAYYHALKGFALPDLKNLFTMAMRSFKYFPSIAELIDLQSNSDIEAELQWAAVIDAVRSLPEKPVFEDSVTSKVVDSLGWRALCMSTEKEIGIFRAQFLRSYKALSNGVKMGYLTLERLQLCGNIKKQLTHGGTNVQDSERERDSKRDEDTEAQGV